MRTATCRNLIFLTTLVLLDSLKAELPPSAYKEQQDKAPEALVIKVRSVTKREIREREGTSTEFTVKAQIEKVERSATKLSPGAIIDIYYTQTHHSRPIAGPSEIPALTEGQVCPAYLSYERIVYAPAAGSYSFRTVR